MTRVRSRAALVSAICLVAGLAISACPVAAGPVLYNTFGPGDAFHVSPFGVDGNTAFQAFRFIPTATGSLEQITVALGRTGAAQTTTTFNLYQDAGGVALGALIESFNVTNVVAPVGVPPFIGAAVTFASVLAPTLTSGVAYWLSYTEPEAPNGVSSLWFFNPLGLSGTRLTSVLPAASNTLPAFRVEANAVPEPATLSLLAIGLLAVGARRQKRSD